MSKLLASVNYDSYGIKSRYMNFRGLVSGNVDRLNGAFRVVDTQSFSVECWVRFEDVTTPQNASGQWLVNERGSALQNDWNYQILLQKANATIRMALRDTADTTTYATDTITALSSNTWYHIAATVNNTTGSTYVVTIYLDGVQDNQVTHTITGGRRIANTNIRVGSAGWGVGDTSVFAAFIGNIDEVRLWSTVRTPEQIARYYKKRLRGKETGLLAYYDFTQGSGGTVTDRTGNGNNLTVEGAQWVTT